MGHATNVQIALGKCHFDAMLLIAVIYRHIEIRQYLRAVLKAQQISPQWQIQTAINKRVKVC
ncbi:MAG: hypothetical protein KF752_20380 [Pirellulaceae bacterium]|nr:hypothetical protein [Pirellulaceae bacterium]